MKVTGWVLMVAGALAAGVAYAQDPPPAPPAAPGIVGAAAESDGTLKIDFSDGSAERIAKDERGSYEDDEPIGQVEVFSEIRISGDRRSVGWMPQYRVCAQSYPCTPELVLYRRGEKPRYLEPHSGILWHWAYSREGGRVIIHYGFPHGDADGKYGLYDLGSLRELEVYTPGADAGPAPAWTKEVE